MNQPHKAGDLPPLPKPTMFFGHTTSHPMFGSEEMHAYGKACAQAAITASPEAPAGDVLLTAQDVADAREMILECTETDLLSGDRSAKKADRAWVYRKLCDAAGLLLGEFPAPPAKPQEPATADAPAREGVMADDLIRAINTHRASRPSEMEGLLRDMKNGHEELTVGYGDFETMATMLATQAPAQEPAPHWCKYCQGKTGEGCPRHPSNFLPAQEPASVEWVGETMRLIEAFGLRLRQFETDLVPEGRVNEARDVLRPHLARMAPSAAPVVGTETPLGTAMACPYCEAEFVLARAPSAPEPVALTEWRAAHAASVAAVKAYNAAVHAARAADEVNGFGFTSVGKEFQAMCEASNAAHRLVKPLLAALATPPQPDAQEGA